MAKKSNTLLVEDEFTGDKETRDKETGDVDSLGEAEQLVNELIAGSASTSSVAGGLDERLVSLSNQVTAQGEQVEKVTDLQANRVTFDSRWRVESGADTDRGSVSHS